MITVQGVEVTQRVPRQTRSSTFPNLPINRPKHLILEAVSRFSYLSFYQVTRLLFSKGSKKYVQELLSELYEDGFVGKAYLPHETGRRGNSLAHYHLESKGHEYLKSQGLAEEGRFRPSELKNISIQHLRHTSAANDLLILCELLPRADLNVTVYKSYSEKQLKRMLGTVSSGSERVAVFDDWVDFRIGRFSAPTAFELDRGTVSKNDWKRRVRVYSRYYSQGYQRDFDTDSLSIAVVVDPRAFKTPDYAQHRVRELLGWVEDELQELAAQSFAEGLFLASFDPSTADPLEVFHSPIWLKPFDPKPAVLLGDLGSN
jgi:hypothetical protein